MSKISWNVLYFSSDSEPTRWTGHSRYRCAPSKCNDNVTQLAPHLQSKISLSSPVPAVILSLAEASPLDEPHFAKDEIQGRSLLSTILLLGILCRLGFPEAVVILFP